MIKKISTFYDKIIGILAQPLPFYYKGRNLQLLISSIFITTLLFNYIFKPFNVYLPEHKTNYFWISFIHALNPLIIIGILSFFISKTKIKTSWNVKKEILLISIFLILAGIMQFLIRDIIYKNSNNWSYKYLYEEIRNTFLTGILITVILTTIKNNTLNKNQSINHTTINKNDKQLKTKIYIATNVKSDAFELNLDSLIFARAEGNYVELYLHYKKNVKKIIKRISLTELANTLEPYKSVIKTHRSYLINLNYLKSIDGNAQGYRIKLHNYNKEIPVSRKMIQEFNKRIKDLALL